MHCKILRCLYRWKSLLGLSHWEVACGVGALKRIRLFVPFETLKLIFNALVRPHFDYCSVVWGNCNLTLSNKLQKLQNRSARILTFSSYDTDVEDLFSKLGWRKLSSQREIQEAIMVFRSLNGLTPEYLSELFVSRSDVTEYLLRNSVSSKRQLFNLWTVVNLRYQLRW